MGFRSDLVRFESGKADISLEVFPNAGQRLKSQLQQLVLVREIEKNIPRIII